MGWSASMFILFTVEIVSFTLLTRSGCFVWFTDQQLVIQALAQAPPNPTFCRVHALLAPSSRIGLLTGLPLCISRMPVEILTLLTRLVGCLCIFPLHSDIYIFLVLIGTCTGIRFFILYIVGTKANFHLATIFPVAIKSNPSLLVSV